MKQQEILEGNKLIAAFDNTWLTEETGFPPEKLKYHSSWDWLMPCFNKLREFQCSYKISEECCEIKSWIGQFNVECVYEDTIEAAYNCMIKFLKWYNENKNK